MLRAVMGFFSCIPKYKAFASKIWLSWLIAKIPDEGLYMIGCNSFRCDRKSKGGGALIYVRNCFLSTATKLLIMRHHEAS